MLDDTHRLALETLEMNKQALIFAPSRASAEKTAEDISALTNFNFPELEKAVLHTISTPTKQCRRLSHCIRKGVAFHHSGLTGEQKELIEEEFRKGKVKIICCTSTLASGISTPAFRVIIKSLKRFSDKWGMNWIPVLEYMQMSGRCVSGDTIIFTREGPLEIEKIIHKYFDDEKIEDKKNVENLEVLSMNLQTLKPEFVKVKTVWKRKVSKTLEIETRSGKKIRLTEEHPFLCFNKAECGKVRLGDNLLQNQDELYHKVMNLRKNTGWGENKIARFLDVFSQRNKIKHWFAGSKPRTNSLLWTEANNLQSGNYKSASYVAGAIGFNILSNPKGPQDFLSHSKIIEIKPNVFMNKQGRQKCSFPTEWSSDLCRFIAKIMSDGNIYHNKKENSYLLRYYNKDKNVQDDYARMCLNLFGKKVKTFWRRGTYQSNFKSFLVGSFLGNLGVPSGKKSFVIRIPPVLFFLSQNRIIDFFNEYVSCDGWIDKKEECIIYNIITCSEKLAYDFSLLLSMLGYVPRLHKKGPNSLRKSNIWVTSVTASQLDNNKKRTNLGNIFPDQIKKTSIIEKEQIVYDLTLEKNHNFIANGLIVHNCGRPEYEKYGEAISIAKDERDKSEIYARYICGVPEDIYSKLEVEPVLRTYLLSLISSGIIRDPASLKEFFSHTFWAHQFKDLPRIEGILEKMLQLLEAWQLVQVAGGESNTDSTTSDFVSANHLTELKERKLHATQLGKRVSELYLDPLTAKHLLDGLKNYSKDKKVFSLLQLISHTLEIRPLLRIKAKDEERIQEELVKRYNLLLEKEPEAYDLEYPEFMDSVKTALFLEEWINEVDEDYLLEKYDIRPGEIRVKLEIADWLLYACEEMGKIIELERKHLAEVSKLRMRIKYGAKEELLRLLKVKGIGRIRSRKLVMNGVKDVGDLKKVDITSLGQILGKAVAEEVKKQLGDETEEIPAGRRKGQLGLGKFA